MKNIYKLPGMSKPATIGLTASGSNAAAPLIPPPTEQALQKLAKRERRLVGRQGWIAFAAARQTVCQEKAKSSASYPETAARWPRRAEELRKLP